MKESADHYYNTFSPRFWLGQLDLRPLGFMRILFGLVLFWSTIDLAPVLFDFFSDGGVAPRSALLGTMVRANRFCIYDIAGPPWVLVSLYILTLISILAFTVGWHSRLASVATFLLVGGIHERALLVFDGSDNVIRVLLFWLMFMPTGARYSVDAILRAARGAPLVTHGTALPMRMGQLQVAWIYLNTTIHKWPGIEWHNGTALRIALGLDHLFTRTLGHLMYNQRWFVAVGTHATLVIEILFLPLFFLPLSRPQGPRTTGRMLASGIVFAVAASAVVVLQVPRVKKLLESLPHGEVALILAIAIAMMVWAVLVLVLWKGEEGPPAWLFQPTYKALAIAGGTSLHLGIATLMSVGNFSYIMISSYFLLYEPEWIEAIVRGLKRIWTSENLKVFYDGECVVCTRVAQTLRGFDVYGNLTLVNFRERGALAGVPASVSKSALDERIHVLDAAGNVTSGWQALLRVARRMPALAPLGLLGAAPGLNQIGKPLYDKVAAHRKELISSTPGEPGKSWLSLVPEGFLGPARGALHLALAVLMVGCMWFSFPDVAKIPAFTFAGHKFGEMDVSPSRMYRPLFETIQELELWQKWDMFSPKPLDHDVYIEGRGQLTDGTQVDVLRGDRGDGGGPLLPPIYPSFFFTRWTKYINNIVYEQDNSPWTLEFGRFVCRRWNYVNTHGRAQLKNFKLYREEKRVPLFGEKEEAWNEAMIWDHHCF